MPRKPLRPEEVPNEVIRACYDFEHQEARDKRNLWIERTCRLCGEKRWVKVNWIRKTARFNQLTGICIHCAGKRNKGIPRRGEAWKGGRRPDGKGYIKVRKTDHHSQPRSGYVFEHRLVMEQILGRPLLPHETAHHKNGDRSDNRPENLELWVRSQPSGQRAEDLVAWAREIIFWYGKLFPETKE